MAQSLLLDIVRDSITEVFEAKNIIDKSTLLSQYPVLNDPVASFVNIYVDDKLRGSYGNASVEHSLLDGIIRHAKLAAFDNKDFSPLKVSEYIHATVELSLLTPKVLLEFSSLESLYKNLNPNIDGLILVHNKTHYLLLPSSWQEHKDPVSFVSALAQSAHLKTSELKEGMLYSFEVETSSDSPLVQ